MEFYVCEHCGNIIVKLTDKKVPVMCCGEKMKLLEAGTTDAAVEKHVPAFTVQDNKVSVQVGSVEHPMIPEHYIEWIVAVTNQGYTVKHLNPSDAPKAEFALAEGVTLQEVYAYCYFLGLWKAEA